MSAQYYRISLFHIDMQAHLHCDNLGFLADRKLKLENLAASL